MKQISGIWLPSGDHHLADYLAKSPVHEGKGTYQRHKYVAAMKHVRGRAHAVDVGANVGLWSRLMVQDFVEVTAFEPIAEHRECFDLNVSGAELLACALGDRPGTLRIKVPPEHVMSAYVSDDGEAVDVVTLDSLWLGDIDFLKIDVEGYEFEVLTGGEKTIRAAKPVIILEQKPNQAERYGRGQWDAVGLLKDWGATEVEVISGDHIMVWR